MVEGGERLGRVIVAIEQRGHQHLNLAGGQRIRRTGIAVVGKPAGRLSFGVRVERRVAPPARKKATAPRPGGERAPSRACASEGRRTPRTPDSPYQAAAGCPPRGL